MTHFGPTSSQPHYSSLDCILGHWNIDNPKTTVCVRTPCISLKALMLNGNLSLFFGSQPEQRNGKEDMGDLQMSWLNVWWAETWKWFIFLELLSLGTGMMGGSADWGGWTLQSSSSVQRRFECGLNLCPHTHMDLFSFPHHIFSRWEGKHFPLFSVSEVWLLQSE